MNKDLLSLDRLSAGDFDVILDRSRVLKKILYEGTPRDSLAGKTLGLLFDKSSTRTRLSFEAGVNQLGGTSTFLSRRDMQLGRGETVADTARVMSRYLDGIVIRTYEQDLVEEFARWASIPVINGLTDLVHPCQILSDLFTIEEKKGTCRGITVAYIGDGNNVANSWINAAGKLPFRLNLACPDGYDPDGPLMERALNESPEGIRLYRSPREAAAAADVIYTDVWASMGQEDEREQRIERFREYQVNQALVDCAADDVIVMHCLPAHRGEEITDEVMEGPHSVVFDQAENRLHVQKAILEILMRGE
ncbi:MAG: ornithine carbamoyltransferase [Deltaproteobacteria bacterium]|nr:ornithine carbamoyltransferase [Deltaproteobacteria bacterium]